MKRCLSIFLSVVLLVVSMTSCGGPKRPEGMPKLYPCSVKIIQDGAPLEGAGVSLFSDDQALMSWPSGGTTDANGIVEFRTYGFPGAPAGTFHVAVTKVENENIATTPEERAKIEAAGLTPNAYDLVDPQYASGQSPLILEVKEGKNPVSEFDVGESIRVSRGEVAL